MDEEKLDSASILVDLIGCLFQSTFMNPAVNDKVSVAKTKKKKLTSDFLL